TKMEKRKSAVHYQSKEKPVVKISMLKHRLLALALLAAFVVTLFAPARQAQAATSYIWSPYPQTGQSGGVTTNNVNWNGGPQ
ncbi:MAG: hypothetical protein ACT4QE_12020, partial [Anaerolineales bacterium]